MQSISRADLTDDKSVRSRPGPCPGRYEQGFAFQALKGWKYDMMET